MAWQRLIVSAPRDKVPETEALLELAGAVSVSLTDAADTPLFEPAPGETPLWPDVVVTALFDGETEVGPVHAQLQSALGRNAEIRLEPLAGTDLVASAASSFAPLKIGPRLWLLSAEDAAPEDGAEAVRLYRGLAFGTGEHPTTVLCLEWLEAALVPGSVVLDYGCGSGVLALAALRLGAAHAFAVDNDPQALEATKANAELNGLSAKLWVGPPESLPAFRADVVLANILARPLIELAGHFADRLITAGHAVLSGVLREQTAEVEEAYRRHFDIGRVVERDGWIRLEARKRAPFAQNIAPTL